MIFFSKNKKQNPKSAQYILIGLHQAMYVKQLSVYGTESIPAYPGLFLTSDPFRTTQKPKKKKMMNVKNDYDESIFWRMFDILQVWNDTEFKIEPCGKFAD